VVASELGRKWIGVNRSQEAITTILHRMANGSDRMGDFVNEKSKKASLPLFSIADFTLFERLRRKHSA
jgi:adenine-specific DNA-methyltransferase